MGYMKHHAIIFTSFNEEYTARAWRRANEVFDREIVTPIQGSISNEQSSFAILPDGSKEGWPESDKYNEKRQIFLDYLVAKSKDDEPKDTRIYGDWVEVWFDEEGESGTSQPK